MLKVDNLFGGYKHEHDTIKNVSIQVEQGEFFTLIGPNGSGKTTLFKLVTGDLPVTKGEIELLERPLAHYSTIEKAKIMAVLSQEERVEFDFSVKEIVSLGRYPHQKGFIKTNSREDSMIIEQAMETTRVRHFANRPFKFLSGGEKQRVLLAKALAQQPKILFLDEPTNHLDIKHTFEMMSLLKEWQKENDLTVIAILHDLNIAALFADRIGLMEQGELIALGDSSILKNEDLLEQVYEVKIHNRAHPQIAKSQVFLTPETGFYSRKVPFYSSYELVKGRNGISITFPSPLRLATTGRNGEGIKWASHFYLSQMNEEDFDTSVNQRAESRVEAKIIPEDQAGSVAMMTKAGLDTVAIVKETIDFIDYLVVVAADTEKNDNYASEIPIITSIQLMVFIDGYFTDGDLLTAIQVSSAAKTKAMCDVGRLGQVVRPFEMEMDDVANGILIAATQKEDSASYTGKHITIGKGISKVVYQAVREALEKTSLYETV